jgi:hypothetical protein
MHRGWNDQEESKPFERGGWQVLSRLYQTDPEGVCPAKLEEGGVVAFRHFIRLLPPR